VRRARIPFSVNVATQQLAAAALADRGPVEETVERTRRERTRLAKALQGLGFDVVPSHTNFILTRPPIDAARLQDALKAQGILTRTFPAEPALAGRLRFTVGLPEEVDRLVESLGRVLASGGGPR
jgi:histidinol-phosphate aminotransferase